MGNKVGKSEDQFDKMVRSIKSKQLQSAIGAQTKITINPQQKYLSIMIQKLSSSNLPEQLKNKISLTLHEKLSKQELIKTVSIASVLRNNQFDIQANKSSIINNASKIKKTYSSKNVGFKFDLKNVNQYIRKNLLHRHSIYNDGKEDQQLTKTDLENYEKQLFEQQKKKQEQEKQTQTKTNLQLALKILKQEIKKMYHPFWKLNKGFADYVANDFALFIASEASGCKRDSQRYELLLRKLIMTWILYLQQGCLYPYKRWLHAFVQLPQSKITKILHSTLLQQIFPINNSYLYHSVMMIISENCPKLKINFQLLIQQCQNITPQLFSINQKLQIQGRFMSSMYQCSQLQTMIAKPQKILQQLQLIKMFICKDIDQFHRLEQSKQYYEIDSDNILGIVNFILTRIPGKIQGIHKQLILLRVVYGDGVYFSHGIASYMLSTLSGSMQFLESEQFLKLVKENPMINKKPISPPTMVKLQSSTNTQSTATRPPSSQQKVLYDSSHYCKQKSRQKKQTYILQPAEQSQSSHSNEESIK